MKENAISLLVLYKWIHNTKVTNFYIEKVWERFPLDWLETLNHLTVNELNLIPYGMVKEEWPNSLKHFLKSAMLFGSFRYNIQKYGDSTNILHLSAKGMSPKKIHEIERMGAFLKDYLLKNNCLYVVDVGSGLGYLDIALAKLGFRVIGLEIDSSKVSTANKFAISERVSDSFESFSFELKNDDESIKQLELLVKSKFNFEATEANNEPAITLVGLHCCGDLSPAIIRAFLKASCFKHLVFFGCCYHSMKFDGKHCLNFPLSHTYVTMKDAFNECSLRLGAQQTRSSWKSQTAEDHRRHVMNVSFRSILEMITQTSNFQFKKSKRKLVHITDETSFESYLDIILSRSNIQDFLKKAYEDFKKFEKYIEPFTMLQVLFQPIIEYFILDDRKEYIKEHGHECELVQLFEDETSPRNCAIVANKLGLLHWTSNLT